MFINFALRTFFTEKSFGIGQFINRENRLKFIYYELVNLGVKGTTPMSFVAETCFMAVTNRCLY